MGMMGSEVSSAILSSSHRVHAGNFGVGYIDLGIHDFANVVSQGECHY